MNKIPLSVPLLKGNELKYVKECLDSGWISSAGSYVEKFEKSIADFVGTKYAVACVNATAGLHIAQLVCGVKPNDYVIAPNLTFVATLNSIKYTGANPILIDADPNSWQMDLGLLESFMKTETELKKVDNNWYSFRKLDGKRIYAVMPVHVLGNIGNLDRLNQLAKKYHLVIIEDSTEALGSYYKQKHSGTLGEMGVFSFNGNKIISTGGGGMIITNNHKLAKLAKHISNTAKVSQLDYIHDQVGYNYRLVNVLAAIGLAQVEQLSKIINIKKGIDSFYRQGLKNISDIVFQEVTSDVDPNCWLFTFKTKKMRSLLKYLNENGVQSRPLWMPMNKLPMYNNQIFVSNTNESSKLYETCISIPSSGSLSPEELKIVVDNIKDFYTLDH